jgi:hypothetical protein
VRKIPLWFWIGLGGIAAWYFIRLAKAANANRLSAEATSAQPTALLPSQLAPVTVTAPALPSLPAPASASTSAPTDDSSLMDFTLTGGA